MLNKETLQQTKDVLDKVISERKITKQISDNLGNLLNEKIALVLHEVANGSKITREELIEALSKIKIDIPEIKIPEITVDVPEVNVPEANVKVEIPEIKVPEAKVVVEQKEINIPEVKTEGIEKAIKDGFSKFKINAPEIKIPETKVNIPSLTWPKGKMPIDGWVRLMGIDLDNPLPVQLRDSKGRPVDLNIGGNSGGGGRAIARIGGIDGSAWGQLLNSDDRLKVSILKNQSEYNDVQTLVTASDIGVSDDTYKDQGSEIDCKGYGLISIYVDSTVNDSTGNQIQFLRKHTSGGTEEYVMPISAQYQHTIGDSDKNIVYDFELGNTIPYLQVQTKATDVDTGGGTKGTVTIKYILGSK